MYFGMENGCLIDIIITMYKHKFSETLRKHTPFGVLEKILKSSDIQTHKLILQDFIRKR